MDGVQSHKRTVTIRGYMLPLVSRSHVVLPTISYVTCLHSLTPFLRAGSSPNCNILRYNSSCPPNSWPNLQSPNCNCGYSRPTARSIINTLASWFDSRLNLEDGGAVSSKRRNMLNYHLHSVPSQMTWIIIIISSSSTGPIVPAHCAAAIAIPIHFSTLVVRQTR